MRRDSQLGPGAAAKIYSVDHRKLGSRLHGMRPRRDILANLRKVTDLEESVLVQYILDLAAKGFPPRLSMMMMFIYAGGTNPIGNYRRSAKPILTTSKLGSEPYTAILQSYDPYEEISLRADKRWGISRRDTIWWG